MNSFYIRFSAIFNQFTDTFFSDSFCCRSRCHYDPQVHQKLFVPLIFFFIIYRHRFLATSSVSETTGKSQAALNSDVNEHVAPPASVPDVSHATPTNPALPDLLAPALPDLLTLYAAPQHDPHHVPVTDLSKGDVVHVPL